MGTTETEVSQASSRMLCADLEPESSMVSSEWSALSTFPGRDQAIKAVEEKLRDPV